jgi:hypothetical protein
MFRRLFGRRPAPEPPPVAQPAPPPPPAPPATLDDAAREFLEGNTDAANLLVSKAREEAPDYFAMMTRETAALQQDLDAAIEQGLLRRREDSDRYTDEHVRVYWNSARTEFETASPRENANALVYSIYIDRIGQLVADLQPDALADFGCACGLPLFNLARKYPSVRFGGIDRQQILKTLNSEAFAAPNLEFADGDVLDWLPVFQPQLRRKMLVHVRTGIMVYPRFLDQLYATAAASGFKYVALYEIASLSCSSWTFHEQDSNFGSEAHRSTMFLHDYASALRRAGFRPITIERMPHGYSLVKNNNLPGDTCVFVVAELDRPA